MRTEDVGFGEDYFESLDNGAGYVDSTMWEDLAHAVKEVFAIDGGRDRSGEINVVDVGCAKGYLVRHLRRRGFDAWGLDISRYALERAPEDTRGYLRWFDLSKQDDSHFGAEAFRLVVCLETLEHIPEESVATAVGHLYRLSVPGGRVLLTVCTAEQPGWDTDPTHVTIRPRGFWTRVLSEAGFDLDPDAVNELRRFWLFSLHAGLFVLVRPE